METQFVHATAKNVKTDTQVYHDFLMSKMFSKEEIENVHKIANKLEDNQ